MIYFHFRGKKKKQAKDMAGKYLPSDFSQCQGSAVSLRWELTAEAVILWPSAEVPPSSLQECWVLSILPHPSPCDSM